MFTLALNSSADVLAHLPMTFVLSESFSVLDGSGSPSDTVSVRVELSVAKVTDRNWNWSRQNLFVFRRDRTRPATAIFVRLPKEVRNA